MPQDLFGDVLVRSRSVRARRSSPVVVSMAAHAAVVAVVILVPLVATDELPIPPRAFDFIVVRPELPAMPAPVRAPRANRSTEVVRQSPDAAPTIAPDRIADETGLEGEHNAPILVPSPFGAVNGLGAAEFGTRIEAPPPPPPSIPIRLHAGIEPPRRIADVTPEYPAAARAARIQGVVIIEATIDAEGNVVAARLLRRVSLLDQAALDAVKQWKYTPARLGGAPVPVIMTVTVNFTLQER